MRLTERLGRHCYNFQVWIKWNTFTKPPQSCPVFNKLLSNCESWDFSLILDRLTENVNFCTLKDRKSAKHREILFFLKAVSWGLKIFGVSNVWFVYFFIFFCDDSETESKQRLRWSAYKIIPDVSQWLVIKCRRGWAGKIEFLGDTVLVAHPSKLTQKM